MIKAWLSAFRLRTLPLALASIGMGSFLAVSVEAFRWEVLLWCALTTLFLQILSNLANDYGDTIHGADSQEREGPSRAVQSGVISPSAMFRAIVLFAALSFCSGVYLLFVALGLERLLTALVFLALGLLAIWAAITYTAGSKPYGYAGFGDISVMIFFGWVAVLGTFYLHTGSFDAWMLLPASSCGFFATGVLNVNNIRDIPSDALAGKKSIPVRIGRENARKYHWFLLISGLICALLFVALHFESYFQCLFLLIIPLLIKNGRAVTILEKPSELDPYLKQLALTALLFVITFGVGIVLK